jgi:RHS repeat-associated protein
VRCIPFFDSLVVADVVKENRAVEWGLMFSAIDGLYYAKARWYDPATGRFTTVDPVKDGVNWYAYCGSNPVGFVDPMGLSETSGSANPEDSAMSDYGRWSATHPGAAAPSGKFDWNTGNINPGYYAGIGTNRGTRGTSFNYAAYYAGMGGYADNFLIRLMRMLSRYPDVTAESQTPSITSIPTPESTPEPMPTMTPVPEPAQNLVYLYRELGMDRLQPDSS